LATVTTSLFVPGFRYCQGEVHTHLIVTRGGRVVRDGRGLGFWFWPIGTAISEVPVNDQSVAVTFKCRSQDFQEVSISAQIWYLVTEPQTIATRFDFSIRTETGAYQSDPLTVIQGALSSAAQEAVWSHVAGHTLESLLKSGLGDLSKTVSHALSGLDFGIQVSRAVVTAVRPERVVEEALQARTRERLQMEADAAGFERRAKATEQERAIQEAELANRLALAKQQQALIDQQAANAQAEAASDVAVLDVRTRGEVSAEAMRSHSQLESKRNENEVEVQHQSALAEVRVVEVQRLLAAHSEHPGGAQAIAVSQLPTSLQNVEVLTMGEAGLQGLFERYAQRTQDR